MLLEARNFANSCFNLMNTHPSTVPLRFVLSGTKLNVVQTEFMILKLELKCSTLKYEDIERVLGHFFSNFIKSTTRNFAFVSGDQQTWIKMWYLRLKQSFKYFWLSPVPGEWLDMAHSEGNFSHFWKNNFTPSLYNFKLLHFGFNC